MEWRKSSYSTDVGDCVEVVQHQDYAHVRDSKHRHGPALTVSAAHWGAFIVEVKSGR